jgi:hypothetical protein
MLLSKAMNLFILLVLSGLAACLISWVFWLFFRFGGVPEERGLSIHYRLKPMMRFLLMVLACAGIAGLWFGTRQLLHGLPVGLISICLGVIAIAMVVMTAGHEIILDEQGIRSRSAICQDKIIAWNDLTHVEKLYNTRAVTNNYYFRSSQGITIVVGDSSFDASDLLQRIRARRPLSEQPYKRRKWYGG